MPRRGHLIALEGPSGAGKTTVVRTAARAFGWVPLSEAFHRLDPPPSLRFRNPAELLALERTLLAEEGRRYRAALTLRRRGHTVIADTGFLGPLTYTAGLVALGDAPRSVLETLRTLVDGPQRSYRIGLPDRIVYLDVPRRTRRRRVDLDPGSHPAEFRKRHEAVGRFEQRFYRTLVEGPLQRRVRFVSGAGSPESVAARVRSALRPLDPPRDTRAAFRAILARLEGAVGHPPMRRRTVFPRHR